MVHKKFAPSLAKMSKNQTSLFLVASIPVFYIKLVRGAKKAGCAVAKGQVSLQFH